MGERPTVLALTTAARLGMMPVALDRLAVVLRKAADAGMSIEDETLDELALCVEALHDLALDTANTSSRFALSLGLTVRPEQPPVLTLLTGGEPV